MTPVLPTQKRVRPCTCRHAFQDERYGRGLRLHTQTPGSKTTGPKLRCTVCGTERDA